MESSVLAAAYLGILLVLVAAYAPSRTGRAIVAGVGALVVLAARIWLVGSGYVYDPAWVRALDVLVGVSFLIVALSVRHHLGPGPQASDGGIAVLASLLALPVAAVATAQLLAPVAPQASGTTTCSGAPVA